MVSLKLPGVKLGMVSNVPPNISSVRMMLVRSTLPVLVKRKVYRMVSPTWAWLTLACLSRSISATALAAVGVAVPVGWLLAYQSEWTLEYG